MLILFLNLLSVSACVILSCLLNFNFSFAAVSKRVGNNWSILSFSIAISISSLMNSSYSLGNQSSFSLFESLSSSPSSSSCFYFDFINKLISVRISLSLCIKYLCWFRETRNSYICVGPFFWFESCSPNSKRYFQSDLYDSFIYFFPYICPCFGRLGRPLSQRYCCGIWNKLALE